MSRIASWRSFTSRCTGCGTPYVAGILSIVALVAAVLPLRLAEAQGAGAVAGSVVTSGALVPLSNVQVSAEGRVAITDVSGRFRLGGLSGDSVTITLRRIGFVPVTQTVRVGAENLRIPMRERAIELNNVVVTGTAGATQRRELGVAVSQINAADVVREAPIQNVQQLINGRAAGVTVLQNSGMVGSGATVRIRGVSSFSLSNQPLIYVDGIRVDNAQGTGPLNQAFGSSTTTRWNDFNPDDIESVEIVKGPAATTLYGTEAANGVIQIITKRGAQGRPRWDFTTRQGLNQFANPEGRLYTNYARDSTGAIQSLDIVDRQAQRGDPIFTNGRLQNYNIGLGGGSPTFQYHVSGGSQDERGALPNNRLKNYTGRATLNLIPSSKINVATSLGYIRSRNDLALEAGGGGPTWATYFSSPAFLGDARNGFRSAPPSAYYDQFQLSQDVNRFTGSVQVNNTPASWFNQSLIFGLDQGNEDSQELSAVHRENVFFFGNEADSGYKAVDLRANRLTTMSYRGTVSRPIGSSIVAKTTAGSDFYLRATRFTSAYGQDFPLPGLTSINSTTANRLNGETTVENNSVGVFFQEEFAVRDRLFLTAGVRSDQNSAFGSNFKRVIYPKFSASWVVSDESFFRLPGVSALKLRSAYGQSGQAPPPYAAVPIFVSATGTGSSAAVTPASAGNPALGAERGYETELGMDAGFFRDRAGIELTYFTGGTRDAILQRQVAPSLGYPGTQYVNAGRLTRNGVELLLRGTPIQRRNLSWDLGFNIGTNRTKVVNLGGDTLLVSSTYVQQRIGYPVGSWFAKRVTGATVDPTTGAVSNVMCDDGKGGTVLCASAPDVYLGRTLPNAEGSFTSGLQLFRNFRLNALVDFKRGYKKLDGNRRVRCNLFRLCRENFYPLEFSPQVVGAASSSAYVSDLIRDASYTKLRELSATFNLPAQFTQRLGASQASLTFAGRNLKTWTKYTGLEPEASFQGGGRGTGGQWEQNILPQLRQFVTTINLSF